MRAFACLLFAAAAAPAWAGEADLPRHPSLSPDGKEVVFSWRGDLWKVGALGGQAARLTSHPAIETRSAWSPDGKRIAFQSDRSGSDNVWVMDADGGGVRQVTKDDNGVLLAEWSADGRDVLFLARREGDVYWEPRPYLVPAEGGPPRRLFGAFGRETAPSRDGKRVLFTRGGASWARRGYRGSDSKDVWLFDADAKSYRRLTERAGNDGRAAWVDEKTFVFLSDRGDQAVELWRRGIDAPETSAQRIASFDGRDVWDLAVSRDGRTAVVVVWDALWRIDLTAASPQPERLRITAPEDAGDAEEIRDVSGDVSEAALSPDGKVLATVAFGDVFVRNVEDKHPTLNVTSSAARDRHIAWSPDGRFLYFSSDEGGNESIQVASVATTRAELRKAYEDSVNPQPPAPQPAPAPEPPKEEEKDDAKKDGADEPPKKTEADRWQDAVRFRVGVVTDTPAHERDPRPSPDGRKLGFRRGLGDVVVLDLETRQETVVVCCWDAEADFRWSPDSHFLAYSRDDPNFNSDVWIVRADGSAPAVNVSRHPANDYAPRWSADGKVLAFLSERGGHEFDVWRVHLDAAMDAMSAAEIAAYHKDAAEAAKKRKPLGSEGLPQPMQPIDPQPVQPRPAAAPPKLDLGDAWKRLVRVTSLRGSESGMEIAPGGDRFFFKGKEGADDVLYAVGWDGKDLKKLAGDAAVQGVSLNGETVVYVAKERAGTVPAAGGAAKTIDTEAKVRVDRAAFAEQKYREAARIVGERFYHPTMKGLDWPALTKKYFELARRTRTTEEFDAVCSYLLGELNGSHLGVRSRGPRRGGDDAPDAQANGRIGVDVEPAPGPTEGTRSFRVRAVVPYGPADRGAMKLAAGDVVSGVDGRPFTASDSFESRFLGRIGKETLLAVRREKDGKALELQVLVTPIAWQAEQQLRYDWWAARNEAKVHELSQGRLGYLHIRAMDEASLDDFERDLYAAADGRDGLVIDVRNNGGGHTADYVLASIMVRPHAYTVPRGGDPKVTTGYPRDRLFIQRWVQPVNMLCNEKSFSNAEILSHAFRTLQRGTLVGQATNGGVISTGSATLLDGTTVRVPFRGWFLPDGTDMENNPAVPDLLVPQTPEAESRGEDEQLRAAVDDLMKRLPAK